MKNLLGFALKVLNPNSEPYLRWSFGRQDVVIYGNRFSSELRTIIPSRTQVRVIDPYLRTEVFVRECALGLLTWMMQKRTKPLMDAYFEQVLRVAKPKLVLTCIIANHSFFRVRSELNPSDKTRFLIFQTGQIWLEEVPPKLDLRRDDVVFALTENYADAWDLRTPVGTQVVQLGSLPSSLQKKFDSISDSKSDSTRSLQGIVGFISSWRPPQLHSGMEIRYKRTGQKEWVPYRHFFSPEINLLPLLVKTLSQELKLRLEILGNAAEGTEASVNEKMFYEEILGTDDESWSYRAKSARDGGNYSQLGLYDLLFATDSALGLEALSMGHMVMFLEVGEACDVRVPFSYPGNSIRETESKSLLKIKNSNAWGTQIALMISLGKEEQDSCLRNIVGEHVVKADAQSAKSAVWEALGAAPTD